MDEKEKQEKLKKLKYIVQVGLDEKVRVSVALRCRDRVTLLRVDEENSYKLTLPTVTYRGFYLVEAISDLLQKYFSYYFFGRESIQKFLQKKRLLQPIHDVNLTHRIEVGSSYVGYAVPYFDDDGVLGLIFLFECEEMFDFVNDIDWYDRGGIERLENLCIYRPEFDKVAMVLKKFLSESEKLRRPDREERRYD